jgi:hypothetical protein
VEIPALGTHSEYRTTLRSMVGAILRVTAVSLVSVMFAQQPDPASPATAGARDSKLLKNVFDYLNMAGSGADEFKPLTQRERNLLFGKSFVNPVWYAKGALSAGQNQWADVPEQWEQGASGYGKRYADIMGQYAIRRTVMFGFESLLHEDNQYFSSRKRGFWPRAGYALASGILARKDNGQRHPSVSLIVGYASGAYLSRFWQPSNDRSVGDAAVSFGVAMGWNIGFGVVKEFLPDMLRPFTRKRNTGGTSPNKLRMPDTELTPPVRPGSPNKRAP